MMPNMETIQPILWMPIGPTGCGKSKYFKELQKQNPEISLYSWDTLRHEWYDRKDYANAYKMSVDDKSFYDKAKRRFSEILDGKSDLYIDNTNLTIEIRKFFIDKAKEAGYKAMAILMPVDLETIIARQLTRGDKNLPVDAVIEQYNALQLPQEGEFDEVITIDINK